MRAGRYKWEARDVTFSGLILGCVCVCVFTTTHMYVLVEATVTVKKSGGKRLSPKCVP